MTKANWGGKRLNSGRRRLVAPVRVGQVWTLAQPVTIGNEKVQSETLKQITTLKIDRCSSDTIVFVDDDGLTFELTRQTEGTNGTTDSSYDPGQTP